MKKENLKGWSVLSYVAICLAVMFGTLYIAGLFHKPEVKTETVYVNTTIIKEVQSPAQVVETPSQNITVAYMTQISAQKLNNHDHSCTSCASFEGVKMLRFGDSCYEDIVVVDYHAEMSSLPTLKGIWKIQCEKGNKEACFRMSHCLWCGNQNKDGSGNIWCVNYIPEET